MVGMSINAFNPDEHPRNADNGQWAKKRNSAPVALLTDDEIEARIAASENRRQFNAEIEDTAGLFNKMAQKAVGTYRLDPTAADDIVQDSFVDVLKRRKSREEGDAGLRELMAERNLMARVAQTIGVSWYSPTAAEGLRHEDTGALRELDEKERQFETQHGRRMTKTEREQLADEIRMSRPPGRRPKPGYHNRITALSLDMGSDHDSNESTIADTLAGGSAVTFDTTAGPAPAFDEIDDQAAVMLHALENRKATRQQIQAQAWSLAVASRGGAEPIEGCVEPNSATKHRKAVEAAGGISVVANRWLDGDATDAETEALFAPFGGEYQSDEAYTTAELLAERGGNIATSLWLGALKTASTKPLLASAAG